VIKENVQHAENA